MRARAAEGIPVSCPGPGPDPSLKLYVIFTDLEATKGALNSAHYLAHDLDTRIVLLVPHVVPYPLPLEDPPVSAEFTRRTMSQLAVEQELEVTIKVYLCRDRNATVRRVLTPDAFVVLGTRQRWWPNEEQRLARLLRRDGHSVFLVDIGKNPSPAIRSAEIRSSL